MWRGVPQPVDLPEPGAGLPAVYVPSQGEIECVRCVTFLYSADPTAATRRATVTFLDGQGVAVAVSACGFTVSAGHQQTVSLFVGGSQFGANDAFIAGGPLYERWLDGLTTVEIGALSMQAGDTITDIRLDVVGYPQDWYDDTDA